MEPPIKFKLCKQHKHDNIKKITLAVEDNYFCFQVTAFFYQKSEFSFKMFIKNALCLTRPITGNKSSNLQKLKLIFLDIIMFILLAKFEFEKWFHFLKNKELSKKIGFPLKPDDVVMLSSHVHEWKGKPRFIV